MAATKNTKAFYNTEIPSDWDVKKLTRVSKIFDGTHYTPNYVTDGVPFYSVEHVTNNRYDDTKYISEEVFAKESQRVTLVKGDILMTRIGDIGTTKYIDWDVRASFYVSLALIKTEEKYIDAKFLSQFINSIYFQRELYQRTIHVAFPKKINLGEIGECNVLLPPLPEQKAIAHVLSKADATIHTTEKLITQKELRKKWFMQQLLTGKKRLKGFGGEWKEEKLEYFIIEYKQKPSIEDNYEILTSSKSGLMKQTDYYGDNRITNRDDADYNVIPPNHITYRSRSDDGLFTFNKNDLGITGLISGYYPVFTITNGDLDFILMYMNYFKQKLTKYAIGTSQLVLAINALKEAKFVLPEHEEQTAIAQVLQAADKEISLLKAKAEKLREQKKGLMQVLLTGKVRLKINNENK